MAQSTLWWLLAGTAVGVELATGTFYLLMLALGLAAACGVQIVRVHDVAETVQALAVWRAARGIDA